MIQKIIEWLNDPIEHRQCKAFIWCIPKYLSVFSAITAVYSFFIGDYYSQNFPKCPFWIISSVFTIVCGCFFVRGALKGKYADPYLKKCSTNDHGAVFYGFINRNDLSDLSIVEIRKIENSIAIPYALAYIDQQDYLNKKLMIVRPFAYYGKGQYIAEDEFEPIKEESYGKYVMDYRPLKYNTLRDML